MDPRSEVILRHPEAFTMPMLIAGLASDDLLSHFPQAQAWCWNAADYAELEQRYASRISFSTQAPEQNFVVGVLFLPKSKELTDYLLQALAAKVELLYLVGEKRAGVERAAKQLATYGKTYKLDSARHCQLWRCDIEEKATPPDLLALAKHVELSVNGQPLVVKTLPGVFSHGRLDQGTALLLAHLEHLPQGKMLDFGCGAGVIGAVLARTYPASEIILLDVDAFAIASAQLTLEANQLKAYVIAGSGIDDAPTELSAIVSNPPFHQGVHTSYAATEHMLKQAEKHLQKKGQLRIVANSFLKYPPIIEQHLSACTTLAKERGFSIYSAEKAR